jgi:uncharacterized protein (TIGR03435 family)
MRHSVSMRSIAVGLLITAASVALYAQEDAAAVTFDVVSIKPTVSNRGGGPGPFVSTTAGRLFARGPLSFFLQYAFGLQAFQFVGAPGWVSSDRFDLEAKEPPGSNHPTQFPSMLRSVLERRFKLATHQETRQLPIYALVVARGGHKLVASRPGDAPETRGGAGQLMATRMTMRALASLLSRMTARLVQDRTGVSGEFRFTLRWTPDDFQRPDPLGRSPVNPEAPSLFTALQEQLGLKLESTRAPVDVVVIDDVQRPTED